MVVATEQITRLSRALDQTGAIISRVRPEQATLPTPCRSWDVRRLINHTVQSVRQFTLMITSGAKYQLSDEDVIGEDWTGAYRDAAAELNAAWARADVSAGAAAAGAEFPLEFRLDLSTVEVIVHGWDVAGATGQPTDLDSELGRFALEWGRSNLKPEFRGEEGSGKAFGPEVGVPHSAPLYDRLAGFFGRTPH